MELGERIGSFGLHVSCGERIKSDKLTRYVSHILMVHLTEISRMSKQFIHLNANCMNSTP